jgi:hypothetical protein
MGLIISDQNPSNRSVKIKLSTYNECGYIGQQPVVSRFEGNDTVFFRQRMGRSPVGGELPSFQITGKDDVLET